MLAQNSIFAAADAYIVMLLYSDGAVDETAMMKKVNNHCKMSNITTHRIHSAVINDSTRNINITNKLFTIFRNYLPQARMRCECELRTQNYVPDRVA